LDEGHPSKAAKVSTLFISISSERRSDVMPPPGEHEDKERSMMIALGIRTLVFFIIFLFQFIEGKRCMGQKATTNSYYIYKMTTTIKYYLLPLSNRNCDFIFFERSFVFADNDEKKRGGSTRP